jgi:ankyrin repeat protein
MTTLTQIYNKTITLKKPFQHDNNFDIAYLTYTGKLSMIADEFNKLSIEDTVKLVNDNNFSNRSALQISAFLGFSNIFLYLLTFDADIYHQDEKLQNFCHLIFYKGEQKTLSIFLNFLRFRLKIESLEAVENLKKTYSFSKLDVNRGKLSRAVNPTESNIKRFETFQQKLKDEAYNFIAKALKIYQIIFSQSDYQGRNPLHYAAMSKYPLCNLVIDDILQFDFFKNDGWDEFVSLFEELQNLEVKNERIMDPRRCQRLEKEFSNLLGDYIIEDLRKRFINGKNELVKSIINSQDKINDTVLHIAAFHGDYRIVNKLLWYKADKKIRNQEGKFPVDLAKDNYVRKTLTNLNKAAKNSDSKNITELVHFGHDINSKLSIFSQAPVHKIIESNKIEKYKVLKKLLDMGADPNLQDSNGWTALHYACELGDFEAVKILLNSKAQIDSYSNNKKTPLHFAAIHNYHDIVKYILEKGNSNYNNNNNFNSNVESFSGNKTQRNFKNIESQNLRESHNEKDMEKFFNNNDNDKQNDKKKDKDKDKENPISKDFNNQVSKTARNFPTNLEKEKNFGISTSGTANFYFNSSNGNGVNNNNNTKRSSMNFNIEKNDLIYNKKDLNNCTPLHLAAKNGSVESLALLLVYGSDLYAKDFRGWNILHYGAFQGHAKIVKYISRYDADYNILKTSRNSQNKLAIEIVRDYNLKHYFHNIWEGAKEGKLDLVRQLINEGENINENSTFLRNTPLHLAVLNNHYLMVRLLLDNGAYGDIKNQDGINCEEYAELINYNINTYITRKKIETRDYMRIQIDLRECLRNVLNVNEKTLNYIICEKNRKVMLWQMIDFSNKITNLLKGGNNSNYSKLSESRLSD